MQRWWDDADQASRVLALVDDADPKMGIGTALLGYHALARRALSGVGTLADAGQVAKAMSELDYAPVVAAVSKAVSDELGELSDPYATLFVADIHSQAALAAPRLAQALVAKGAPWPRALARVADVIGVPLRSLGRYPDAVLRPGLDPVSLNDISDRSLMEWASHVSESVPIETVSKAGRQRQRGNAAEEVWDESKVKRDQLGQFAEQSGVDMAERRARRARRRKRTEAREAQAAARASARAPGKAKGRAGGPAKGRTGGPAKGRAPGMASARKPTAAEARAMIANRPKATPPGPFMEQDQRTDSIWNIPRSHPIAAGIGETFTPTVDMFSWTDQFGSNGEGELHTYDRYFSKVGGEAAWPIKEHRWSQAYLDEQLEEMLEDADEGQTRASFSAQEWLEMRERLREAKGDPIDYGASRDEYYTQLKMDEEGTAITKFPIAYDFPAKLTAVKFAGIDPDAQQRVYLPADREDLPQNAHAWDPHTYNTNFKPTLRVAWFSGPDGHLYSMEFPAYSVIPIPATFNLSGVGPVHEVESSKAARRTRTRSHTAEQWDETRVNRDEQGQFAVQAASADELKARRERRARRAQRTEAKRSEEAKAPAKGRAPAKAKGRARGSAKARGGQRATARTPDQARAREAANASLRSRTLTSDEKPIGIPEKTRRNAPEKGLYTLDEPLYSLWPLDPNVPQALMTEEAMMHYVRSKVLARGRPTSHEREDYLDESDTPPTGVREIYRYEPGTVALSGRGEHRGYFDQANAEQIDQDMSVEHHSSQDRNFAEQAPGRISSYHDVGSRQMFFRNVPIHAMVTTYSKADVAKAGRQRTHGAAAEAWDETKVKRDELGQFATQAARVDEQEERSARRERRKRRKERAVARTAAVRAPGKAKGRAPGAAKGRAPVSAKGRAPRSATARVPARASTRVAPSARTRERLAMDVKPLSWADAVMEPYRTKLGQFLSPTGITPGLGYMPIGRNQTDRVRDAMDYGDGFFVSTHLEELIEMGSDPVEAMTRVINTYGGSAKTITDRDRLDIAADRVLSEVTQVWSTDAPSETMIAEMEDAEPDWPFNVPFGTGVYLTEGPDGPELKQIDGVGDVSNVTVPTVVGTRTRPVVYELVGLAQMVRQAHGGPAAAVKARDAGRRALGRVASNVIFREKRKEDRWFDHEAWAEYKLTDEYAKRVHADATALEATLKEESVADTILSDFAEVMNLHVEPLPMEAKMETAELLLRKNEGRPVRLDNRDVFMVLSRLDTVDGWEEIERRREEGR